MRKTTQHIQKGQVLKVKKGKYKGKEYMHYGGIEEFFNSNSTALRFHPAFIELQRTEKIQGEKVFFGKINNSQVFILAKHLQ